MATGAVLGARHARQIFDIAALADTARSSTHQESVSPRLNLPPLETPSVEVISDEES